MQVHLAQQSQDQAIEDRKVAARPPAPREWWCQSHCLMKNKCAGHFLSTVVPAEP
jgi:hypothetical protein